MKKQLLFLVTLLFPILIYAQTTEEFPVTWVGEVGVSIEGDTITKTASSSWSNAGAGSRNILKDGEDGWVEFKAIRKDKSMMLGLSPYDADVKHTSIHYAFYLHADGQLRIYEKGSTKKTVGPYFIGDVLSINRVGDQIYYKLNGETVDTSASPSTGRLIVDATIYTKGGSFENVVASFAVPIIPDLRTSHTVEWTELVNTSIDNNKLVKTTTTNAWDAGGISKNILLAGQDGWMEYAIAHNSTSKMLGLSGSNSNADYKTIRYAWYIVADGRLMIYENGVKKITVGSYLIGDVLSIDRTNGKVEYKWNGEVVYTALGDSNHSLTVDASINTGQAIFEPVTVSFDEPELVVHVQGQDVVWTEAQLVAINEDTLYSSTSGYGGAVSKNKLLTGKDGWFETTVLETNKTRWIGFTPYSFSTAYADLDYSLKLYLNSFLYVFEKGTQKANLGTYNQGDILSIERAGTSINYIRNGAILYTSESPSETDLVVDVSMYSLNGTLNNVQASFEVYENIIRPGHDVTWGEGLYVTIDNNNIISQRTSSAGAASKNKLLKGEDGWAEITVDTNNTRRYFGLSYFNKDIGTASIDYAFELYENKILYIREKGVRKATIGKYFSGDLLSIERIDNTIKYFRNGTLVYTSESPSETDLIIDTYLYKLGTAITKARASFSIPIVIERPGQKVQWTNFYKAEADFNTLTSTSTTGAAASKNKLLAGQSGWAEMTVDTNNTRKYFGFATYNKDNGGKMNYSFYANTDKNLYVYESGVKKKTIGVYYKDDILSIERIGNQINYLRNGIMVYTSETPSETDLIIDTYLYRNRTSIINARASFGIPPKEIRGFPIAFTNEAGLSIDGNTLTKTAGNSGSNAGAASLNILEASKDGWIQMTAGERNKRLTFGFNTKSENNTETEIDFGLRLYHNGTIYILESGASKGTFGQFYPEDIFSIERKNGAILYKKNGTLLYTSATTSNDTLIFDASLYHNGAVLADARASFLYPCDTDEDGDGICAAVDCDDADPNLPRDPGSTCDDGDIYTIKDVIQSDGCTCKGKTTNNNTEDEPIAGTGGGFFIPDDHPFDPDIRYSDGRVVIGNDIIQKPIDYRLFVEDGILTEEVVIALKNTNQWADYVFEKDYPRNSIEQVAEFIQKNKHLPNVPSAKEIVDKGIKVGEMNAVLLRQIEELWLMMIEVKADNESIQKENLLLKKRLTFLNELIRSSTNEK